MVVGVVQLGQVVGKAGLVVLGHGAAPPVDVHVGALAGAHLNDDLLLVGVVLDVDLLNLDVGIVLHEALHGSFVGGLVGLLVADVPQQDVHGLRGQLGDLGQCRHGRYDQHQSQNQNQYLLHVLFLLIYFTASAAKILNIKQKRQTIGNQSGEIALICVHFIGNMLTCQ